MVVVIELSVLVEGAVAVGAAPGLLNTEKLRTRDPILRKFTSQRHANVGTRNAILPF